MINVLVTLEPAAGRDDEFRTKLGELLDRVRQEPGCHGVHWGPVTGDERKIAIVERYADQAALEAHQQSSHMSELGPNVMAMCAGAPSAVMFEEI